MSTGVEPEAESRGRGAFITGILKHALNASTATRKVTSGLGRNWLVRLLLFGLPPVAVLVVMNMFWTVHIANIGCVADRTANGVTYSPAEMFAARPARDRCSLSLAELRGANQTVDMTPPPAARHVQVALTKGRFQWMTFHLVAAIILPVIGVVSLVLIWRNLRWWRGILVGGAALGGGLFWGIGAVGDLSRVRFDTASLLVPTKVHALSRYDFAFQSSAWEGVRWDYGAGLAVTVILIFGAASVLAERGADANNEGWEERERKRRDLKLVIGCGAILMTFLAFYVGEWLGWPAHFPATSAATRGPEEFKAMATGLRLYFGTGYTLALLAFAIPAVLALPAPVQESETARGGGDTGGFLYQFVFSKDEMTMLLAVLTPFATTLIGAAITL